MQIKRTTAAAAGDCTVARLNCTAVDLIAGIAAIADGGSRFHKLENYPVNTAAFYVQFNVNVALSVSLRSSCKICKSLNACVAATDT